MRRRSLSALWAAALLLGSSAGAAAATEAFVRTRNARVQRAPGAGAALVVTLQPGATVTVLEALPDAGPWVRVSTDAGPGVMHRATLSMTPPQRELTSRDGGPSVDVEAFVSSGAAVRAFSEPVTEYAREKVYYSALDQLLVAEAVSRGLSDAALAAHAADAGLTPAVGATP